MAIKIYNKLVRDYIPKIIINQNRKYSTKILDKQQYRQALIEKLSEEVTEFSENPSAEELADIYEVLAAISKSMGLSADEIQEIQNAKKDSRGGFDDRILLEWVEE